MASFLSASCSITRFKLVDAAPAELLATVPTKLKQFAFQNIDEIPEQRAFGWVNFDDMLDSHWRISPPEKGKFFTFSLRVDTRRIPPAVIKKDVRVAINKEMERIRELGKEFISREHKKELKEQVILRLRSRFALGTLAPIVAPDLPLLSMNIFDNNDTPTTQKTKKAKDF